MSTSLSIGEARTILRHGDSAGQLALIQAANCIMEHCEDDGAVTIEDMLRCLDFPETVTSEMGARSLYVRTGRDGLGWNVPDRFEDFSTDKADWLAYLKEQGIYPN